MDKKFNNPYIEGGDAFVLLHDNKYYLYCTGDTEESYNLYLDKKGWQTNKGERDGIEVFVSNDMQEWTNLGYCLEKGEGVVGNEMFWSPEVYFYNNKFYMTYTADEHCCIAVADKPEGPFICETKEYLIKDRAIDAHLLFDDGKIYLYYAKLDGGNVIHVTEMEEDLSRVKDENGVLVIKAQSKTWENRADHWWPISEGPFVLKHNGLYYLSYSCNDVTNKDYAVGYAVSKSPFGPFERYENNPILIGNGKLRGFGHHSFVYDKDGDLICVHHCHNPYGKILTPRRICFQKAEFKKNPNGGNDILSIEVSE